MVYISLSNLETHFPEGDILYLWQLKKKKKSQSYLHVLKVA